MKPDLAHRMTDQELSDLEKRIAAEYKKAADELTDKINAYFERFKERDAEQLQLLQDGKITKQQYTQWRLAQIGRGRRFEALRDRIAERMTRANEVAAAYINDSTPGIYSINRNYATYTIEQQVGADVGFDLWDEQTVRRLLVERPDLMPYYPPELAVRRGFDLAWGKNQITRQVTTGILQGESIKHLADRLQTNIPTMNRDSAIRSARTAVTGAQNAGRQDSYIAAEKMGISLKKQWIATLDNRTRHAHAMADQQVVEEDKPFKLDGYDMMFPGDKSAPGYLVYNCRCTMIALVDGVDMSDAKRRAKDPVTGETVIIENMSYAEWAGWKSETHTTKHDITAQQRFAQSASQFVPAKSIEEAERYAKRFVSEFESKYSGRVSYKGLSLDVANEINRTIFQIFESFDVGRLENISVMNRREKIWKSTTAEAAYRWGTTGGMFINPAYYKDKKAITAHQKEVKSALDAILSQSEIAKRVAKGKQKEYLDAILATERTNVGDINAGDTVMHEMGHFLDDVLFGLQKTSSSFDISGSMIKYAGGISGYATASSAEYVAESFVAWAKGETDILDPELVKIFEEATKWEKK